MPRPCGLGGIAFMTGTKKTFLLPCSQCAGDLEVVAGQAGGHVDCGSCGTRNEVPTFRDLGRLPVKPEDMRPQPQKWSWRHATALAGVLCAAVAWGTAAVVGSSPRSAFDLPAVRAQIHAADDTSLYRALEEFSTAEVNRGMAPQERLLQRQALFATGMARVLQVIGGLGAAAAVVSGLLAFLAPRP